MRSRQASAHKGHHPRHLQHIHRPEDRLRQVVHASAHRRAAALARGVLLRAHRVRRGLDHRAVEQRQSLGQSARPALAAFERAQSCERQRWVIEQLAIEN